MNPTWLPDPQHYQRVISLFLRVLGLVYLSAFLSCLLQVKGLYGSGGIIPLVDYMPALPFEGWQRWVALPTLFWVSQADTVLLLVPSLGVLCSLALLAGFARAPSLAGAWLCYLSLVNAGPVFMQFQWDMLLLEAGFLTALLLAQPSLGILLFRWLLFRFMWMSGLVKVLSDDPLWAGGGALTVHFETQPLPTVLGWYAHQLPEVLLRIGTFSTLIIELLLPFLVFTPRRFRLIAFWAFAALQALILLTGNYNFFNLLTLALCLFLLEDRDLPGRSGSAAVSKPAGSPGPLRWAWTGGDRAGTGGDSFDRDGSSTRAGTCLCTPLR